LFTEVVSSPAQLLDALMSALDGDASETVTLLEQTLNLADEKYAAIAQSGPGDAQSSLQRTAEDAADGAITEMSAFVEEEDLSKEQLQMIKVRDTGLQLAALASYIRAIKENALDRYRRRLALCFRWSRRSTTARRSSCS
jgi:hypothetical protein